MIIYVTQIKTSNVFLPSEKIPDGAKVICCSTGKEGGFSAGYNQILQGEVFKVILNDEKKLIYA